MAKLSVIVGTRNRAGSIIRCLDSIAAACVQAEAAAEILVVDNGSNDGTSALVGNWARTAPVPAHLLSEPDPGLARAHNRALDAARGELLAITDDDCRVHREYVNDLLRHDQEDRGCMVVRGGRIELGDHDDLPLTINTARSRRRWTRTLRSARDQRIGGYLNGCNLAMRRAVIDRIGGFDESFGPGSYIGSGADTDFIYRAYLAGITLEYVPDMVVFHHHGRRGVGEGRQVIRRYTIANGALFVRYLCKDRDLCRVFYGDLREAALGILRRRNTQSPRELFANHDLLAAAALGAFRYILLRQRRRSRAGLQRLIR